MKEVSPQVLFFFNELKLILFNSPNAGSPHLNVSPNKHQNSSGLKKKKKHLCLKFTLKLVSDQHST